MEQHQRSGNSRNRRKKARTRTEPKPKQEPVLIVARRPDSPLLMKVSNRNIAASARPKRARDAEHAGASDAMNDAALDATSPAGTHHADGHHAGHQALEDVKLAPAHAEPPRRVVRIAQTSSAILDDGVLRRERLLERLVNSEGRSAISRVANELLNGTEPLPETQEVHLQLLEHVDERRARDAMDVLARLFTSQTPIKRPILDQRLRRLETEADEPETREKAASLRRSMRVA